MSATAAISDFAATRYLPGDPRSRRLRGAAIAVAVALHAGVIALLLVAKFPAEPPKPVVYDLVFEAPSAPAAVSVAPATVAPAPPQPAPPPLAKPAPPPVAQPAPAPVQMVMPAPPPERPAPPMERAFRPAAQKPTVRAPAASAPAAPSVANVAPSAAPPGPVAALHPVPDPAYGMALLSRLAQFKDYPLPARQHGIQGRVILRLAVARNGRVAGTSIEHSSGAEILDDAALAMVHRAEPLPPLPPSFPGAVAEFRVPIDFALSQR